MTDAERTEDMQDPPHLVEPSAGALSMGDFAPAVWLTYTFARDWYEDALDEAGHPLAELVTDPLRPHRKAVRREIMFATCAVEAYLVEWVRDDVLHRDYRALKEYFPAGARSGLKEKWKDVLEALVRDKHITVAPIFEGRHAEEWARLLTYRNGLVHARTARPDTSDLPANEKPVPDFYVLNSLVRGWACHVVAERIETLHRTLGSAPPGWLVQPPLTPPPSV